MIMKIQKYHLFLILVLLFFAACGVAKKNRCNTCPNFSSTQTFQK